MAGDGVATKENRYEFRIFGAGSYAAFRWLAGAVDGAPEKPRTDIYFVAPGLTGAGLKLRGGRLDLKRLAGKAGRFELWRPDGQAELPLSGAEIACRFVAPAGLPVFVDMAQDYDAASLIAAARADGRLTAVAVTKRRQQAQSGEDLIEHTLLDIGRARAETTFAVEGPDPARLEALLARAGLSGAANVSYPRHLQQLAFDRMN